MEPTATPSQVDEVARTLREDPAVDHVDYMDREESYATFRELFADDPDILAAVTAADTPASFSIWSDRSEATADRFRDLPGLFKLAVAAC
jgi:cell division protein FtsX